MGRTRIVFALYIVTIHLLLIAAVVKSDFVANVGKTLGLLPPEEFNGDYYRLTVQSALKDRDTPAGAVLLFGDSILASLDAQRISGTAINQGVVGDTARSLKYRLPLYQAIDRAKTIVIMVGTNDLKYREPATIGTDFVDLLAALPASKPKMVGAILPVDGNNLLVRQRPWLTNSRIEAANRAISRACDQVADCKFFDVRDRTAAYFPDNPAMFRADGWHLSYVGRRLLEDFLAGGLKENHPQD
ncbi:MAG TPA: GDSL-type esterase/lipase family protein [Aliidongia sp.]|uniref:GDSL-type esterase/lipase family protein n=1 Tax=Aliidongia sp. TaxID=1914230 RepID=UPI002DDD7F39|nr:GDSL-type esterase/lipase family protein [Aliidongia sp.]HEV2672899.1 GDSL-type esterase/lipase family protein [Aliidongia sp.]